MLRVCCISLIACLSLLSALAQQNRSELLPFIPAGYDTIAASYGDINGDKRSDVLLALKNKSEDIEPGQSQDFDSLINIKRPLLLLLRKPDGRLQLLHRNDNIIFCKACGGIMGDSFEGVYFEKDKFVIAHYGGSADRWSYQFIFRFEPALNDAVLIAEKSDHYHTSNPNKGTSLTIPGSEVVNNRFSNYSSEAINNYPGFKALVTAPKSFFHNAPTAGTRRKGYVVKGDTVQVLRTMRNYVYVEYTNKNDDSFWGYLLKKDIRLQ